MWHQKNITLQKAKDYFLYSYKNNDKYLDFSCGLTNGWLGANNKFISSKSKLFLNKKTYFPEALTTKRLKNYLSLFYTYFPKLNNYTPYIISYKNWWNFLINNSSFLLMEEIEKYTQSCFPKFTTNTQENSINIPLKRNVTK